MSDADVGLSNPHTKQFADRLQYAWGRVKALENELAELKCRPQAVPAGYELVPNVLIEILRHASKSHIETGTVSFGDMNGIALILDELSAAKEQP